MMTNKNTIRNDIRFLKKTLTVILVGVFLFTNTLGWAKEGELFSTAIENEASSSSPAKNSKLAPSSRFNNEDFKISLTVAAICKHIEHDGNLDDKSYLNDVLTRLDASKNPNITVLPHEIIIDILVEDLAVRYFDPTEANVITPYSDISKLSTKIIGPRLNRQIIHRVKALSSGHEISESEIKSATQIYEAFKQNHIVPSYTAVRGTRESEVDAAIRGAAKILAEQNTNVVFEKNARLGKWCFRRSSIYLPVSESLCELAGQILEKSGNKSILLKLRGNNEKDIIKALRSIFADSEDFERSFKANGIACIYKYKKILFVAPYGDSTGAPLKFIAPHLGVEKLAYVLNYELEDADARVYNPNLGSKDGLNEFIKSEGGFDVIGFSILQVVLRATLEMLCKVRSEQPDALIMIGGSELVNLPEKFFYAVPYDVAVTGDGMPILDVIKVFKKGFSKQENIEEIKKVKGVITSERKGEEVQLVRTGKVERLLDRNEYPDFIKNIPYENPDLTHGKKYFSFNADNKGGQTPVFWDDIGRRTLRVTIADFCSGKCIFCNAQRNVHGSPPVDQIMDYIRANYKGHDSIQFSSVDFLYDKKYAEDLCRALIASEFKDVPKLFVSRVNKINQELVDLLKEAGFVVAAHGIESFDDNILKKLRKGATRRLSIETLDIELRAGIRPGVYIMFFTPWSTVETTFDTLDLSLKYVREGAYLNLIPDIDVHFGTPLAEMEDIIQTVEINYPGMYCPLKYATTAKILDGELRQLRDRTHEIFDAVMAKSNVPHPHQNSLTVYSLLVFKAFCYAYKEKHPNDVNINKRIKLVDETIRQIIDKEMITVEGKLLVFDPQKYPDQAKIPSGEESSLNLEDYVRSRLPDGLSEVIKNDNVVIELHRGPQSYTDQYLRNMSWRGYLIKLIKETEESRFKLYLLEREGKKIFVFANLIGPTRELTVLQMLKYSNIPDSKIKIRQFDFDLKKILNSTPLNSYAGKIKTAIITHDIEDFWRVIKKIEPSAEIAERIKGDFVNIIIVKRKTGEFVLVSDLNYAYGTHVANVVEYFVSGADKMGLGISEVILKSACGAVGKDIAINDIVLPTALYYGGKKETLEANRKIDDLKIRRFLPRNVMLHQLPVFTLPTVLSGSISLSRQMESLGGGAVELELWHLCNTLKNYPQVKFSAFFEVHDKPSTGSDKVLSLGKDIPAFRNEEKMKDAGEAVTKYILSDNPGEEPRTLLIDDLHLTIKDILNVVSQGIISKETADDAIFLLHDTIFGNTASLAIKDFVASRRWSELAQFVGSSAGRRRYIDTMYRHLDKTKEYNGYDVIILSSRTDEEANDQKKILDLLFKGVKTKNGQPVRIISVVERGWEKYRKQEKEQREGAGNFLATLMSYVEACKVMPELDSLWKSHKIKIMMIHNGGNAVRAIPDSISYNNSRGAQHMVGSIRTEEGDVPITPIIFTVLSNLDFALSNNNLSLDLFWASEMLIPYKEAKNFKSIEDKLTEVMATELDPSGSFTCEDLKIKGYYYHVKGEADIGYAAPMAYADNPELFKKLLQGCDLLMQDVGAQRFSREFIEEAVRKFSQVISARSMNIEIAYHVMEPLFVINEGLSLYKRKIDFSSCNVKSIEDILDKMKSENGISYLSKLKTVKYISEKGSMPDGSGIYEDGAFYREMIDFYVKLMRRAAGDRKRLKGLGSLGKYDDIYWWSYRSPREKLNADLEMIADIAEKKRIVDTRGNVFYEYPSLLDKIKAEDHRRLRRIERPVENVIIGGESYSFTVEEVKRGIQIGDVKIRGSIVRNCVLLQGSEVIDSVIEDVKGRVRVKDSVIMGSTAPEIHVDTSHVVNIITPKSVYFFQEAAAGIFRPGIKDKNSGVDGETIFTVPIGVDGRITDDSVLPGNIDSAENLRSMPCSIKENEKIMTTAKSIADASLARSIDNSTSEENNGNAALGKYLSFVGSYNSYYESARDPINALNIKMSREAILEASIDVLGSGTAVISDAGRLYDIPLKELLEQKVELLSGEFANKFNKIYLLDLNAMAMQETIDMLGLTEEQRKRIIIVKADLSLIFPKLVKRIGLVLSENQHLSHVEMIGIIERETRAFINDPNNWLTLPFPDKSVNFFVSSGGLASICQGFFRYLNKEIKGLNGWQETDENAILLKKQFLFLASAVARKFTQEVSRVSSGIIYLSSAVDASPTNMSVLGVTDLKDLFDMKKTFSFIWGECMGYQNRFCRSEVM